MILPESCKVGGKKVVKEMEEGRGRENSEKRGHMFIPRRAQTTE